MEQVWVVVGKHDNRFVAVYNSSEAADLFITRSYRYAPDGVSGYDEYAIAQAPCWNLNDLQSAFDEAQR